MEKPTTPGVWYVVTSPNGCTVTDANGLTLATVEAGSQSVVQATTTTTTLSDSAALLRSANFNSAPVLAVQGGGNSGGSGGGEGGEPDEILPAGYSAVSFFENTAEQLFITDYTEENVTAFELDFWPINADTNHAAPFTNYWRDASPATRLTPSNGAYWNFYLRAKPTPVRSLYVAGLGLDKRTVIGSTQDSVYGFGERQATSDYSVASDNPLPFYLFCRNASTATPTPNIYRIFRLTFWEEKYKAFEVVPCLKNGVPCFYNKVTGADYFSAQDVPVTVGLTKAQARKIDSLLPDGGGSLTITIPWDIVDINNEVADSAVQSAITKAEQKGWTLTIKTYF